MFTSFLTPKSVGSGVNVLLDMEIPRFHRITWHLARDCVVLKQAGAFHTSEMADVQCSEDLTGVTGVRPSSRVLFAHEVRNILVNKLDAQPANFRHVPKFGSFLNSAKECGTLNHEFLWINFDQIDCPVMVPSKIPSKIPSRCSFPIRETSFIARF